MSGSDLDAIYCRWSGHKKAKEDDIEAQLLKTRACVEADGRQVYREYTDTGISGAISKRRGLDALLTDAIAHRFTRVVMTHPDRLSRGEPWERPLLERTLKDAHIALIYTDYKPQDTPEGQMADDMLSLFAKYERQRIHQRMADKRQAKIEAGHPWRSKPPYGWQYVRPAGKEAHGHFEIDPAQGPIVAEIFTRVVGGESAYALVADLNGRGVPSAGGGRWSQAVINTLLHNPIHMGKIATNRYYSVKPVKPRDEYTAQRARSTRQRPMSEWQYIEIDDRIVSPELWEQAQRALTNNKRFSMRNARHAYALSGLLRCGQPMEDRPGGVCGRVMTGSKNGKDTYTYCCSRGPSSDATRTTRCCGRIRAEDAEKRLWNWILDAYMHPDNLQAEFAKQQTGAGQQRGRLTEQLASAHTRQVALQAKLDSLLLASLSPGADRTTYARVEAHLVAQRDGAAAEIAHLEEQLAAAQASEWAWRDFDIFASMTLHELAHLTLHGANEPDSHKERFIRAMIDEVLVHPDGTLTLEGHLPRLVTVEERTIVTTALRCSSHNPPYHFTIVLPAAA